jgi:transcriptional regulator of arginine metabolism
MFMQNSRNFMHTHTASAHSASSSAARRSALKAIIRDSIVGRQEDLVRLLKRAGHRVTQSSVSRDLRELGVAKRGDRYVLPGDDLPVVDNFAAVAPFVRAISRAGDSLIVVRTTAGAAQSVAIVLDHAVWPGVVGTISGDDTIFIATEGTAAQRAVVGRLRERFPS